MCCWISFLLMVEELSKVMAVPLLYGMQEAIVLYYRLSFPSFD